MPRSVKYNRSKSASSQTLLEYLASSFTYLTESEWTWHIGEGHVSVNGIVEFDVHRVLLQHDLITFAPPRSMEPEVDDTHITILYVDDFLIVCSKNGNLPVAEGGRYCENTLIGVLMRCGLRTFYTVNTIHRETASFDVSSETLCKKRAIEVQQTRQHSVSPCKPIPLSVMRRANNTCSSNVGGHKSSESNKSEVKLFVVHRLDKETSGIVIIARSAYAAHILAEQFIEPSVLHGNVNATSKAIKCKEESLLTTDKDNCKETNNGHKQSSESNDAIMQSNTAIDTKMRKRVVKRYVAVLVGCAQVGRTYNVNAPIGCMANDNTMKDKAAHQKLKKLKMMCYATENINGDAEIGENNDQNANSQQHKHSYNCEDKNASLQEEQKEKDKLGKNAKSSIYILANDISLNLSVAQVTTYTGRTHQIRIHCAHIGFPIFGDKLYYTETIGMLGHSYAVDDDVYLTRVRATELESYMEDKHVTGIKVKRHLLHANYINFTHPESAESMEFVDNPFESFYHDVLIESKSVE